jgi:hypothetical protein
MVARASAGTADGNERLVDRYWLAGTGSKKSLPDGGIKRARMVVVQADLELGRDPINPDAHEFRTL